MHSYNNNANLNAIPEILFIDPHIACLFNFLSRSSSKTICAPTWKTLFNHYFPIVFPILISSLRSISYWSQPLISLISAPKAPYTLELFWTIFELFKKRRAHSFWKFKFISFWITITTTQAIITTITHLFSNTFKEADTPTFVIQTQELQNLNWWGYSYRKSSVILNIT